MRCGIVGSPEVGDVSCVKLNLPTRTSHTGTGRRGVRQMTEIHGRHRRIELLGRIARLGRRWRLGVGPELAVNALDQLPARRQARGELREDLVLFVLPRKVRIGARLTVGIALVLVSGEEPQPIANRRGRRSCC